MAEAYTMRVAQFVDGFFFVLVEDAPSDFPRSKYVVASLSFFCRHVCMRTDLAERAEAPRLDFEFALA